LLDSDFWLGWAIVASLWGHYSGSSDTRAQSNAKFAEEGNAEKLFESIKEHAKRTESIIPEEEDFTSNVVQEAGVLLALLVYFARIGARSFPSGKLLNSHAEPIEMHHIFPRKVLDRAEFQDSSTIADRLGNLTLLFRSDNEYIKDTPPAEYLPDCKDDDLRHHGIPLDKNLWDLTRYTEFCSERERWLAQIVKDLFRSLGVP
jgi:hypothetical protein